MTVFSLFTLLGGLAFFLYGMSQMSQSLERIAGARMEQIINKMTRSRIMGLALGCVITIAIQSSSAVTVMLVGLVNSGLMELSNTIGVIMGSNIGTTITAWIMSLIGVSSDNFFIRMLKPESFSPLLAFAGIALIMLSKEPKRQELGNCFLGFAILMYGMVLMSGSVAPLADSPEFSSMLTTFENPLLGVLVGFVVTAIIQSSAASVGMLQALSMTGGISYGMALPVIMGQNIGTCATALLSSIGVNRNAKRVTAIHLSFNLIGTATFMVLYYGLHALLDFQFLENSINPAGIALCHSIFNIATTCLLLPFSNQLVWIAETLIKDDEEPSQVFLDERLLETPPIAVAECEKLSMEMARMASDSVLGAIDNYFDEQRSRSDRVCELEQQIDSFEDRLGSYLIKLSGVDISARDQKIVAKMLHSISNFERMSDRARDLVYTAREIADKNLQLSDEARQELAFLERAVRDILDKSITAYTTNDPALARTVEPLEQVINMMVDEFRFNHILRVQTGECTLERGFVFADTLSDYERIADRCSDIAIAVLESSEEQLKPHEYLRKLKSEDNDEFQRQFEEYQERYLPTPV
ncbi:MAG: Na/Pi cotransporter family protein [Atopobiaceae bacterium]|nr:Na/Pi cotransporter family protein [Atopobiaceae bacterium]